MAWLGGGGSGAQTIFNNNLAYNGGGGGGYRLTLTLYLDQSAAQLPVVTWRLISGVTLVCHLQVALTFRHKRSRFKP